LSAFFALENIDFDLNPVYIISIHQTKTGVLIKMLSSYSFIFGLIVKLFLLLTPFFVLSVFVTACDGMEFKKRKKLAVRTGMAVICATIILYLFGKVIFDCLGISLNAFQIGAGLVLMLNGIDMVRSSHAPNRQLEEHSDPAVVPLAIPTTVGPGTIGTLLVMGASAAERAAEAQCDRWLFLTVEVAAILFASCGIGIMLYFSENINRLLKNKGVGILSKLTGMYIVALAAQIIFDGIRGFLPGLAAAGNAGM
jgi:multiple antibiotic resistance protein